MIPSGRSSSSVTACSYGRPVVSAMSRPSRQIVEVAVHVTRPRRPGQRPRQAERRGLLARCETVTEELVAVLGEPGGVAEQLANGHRWHTLAGRHADEVGEALADWLVEFQEAGVDELEDDRRRDDLGDAGDAEAVGRRHAVHRVVRRARAEAGGVDDVPVDRHGDRCRPVAAARQLTGDQIVEASP